MSDEIKTASYRELTPEEIDFYMRRGRQLRAETFWHLAERIARRLRAAAGAPAADGPLHFGARIKGPVPHVD